MRFKVPKLQVSNYFPFASMAHGTWRGRIKFVSLEVCQSKRHVFFWEGIREKSERFGDRSSEDELVEGVRIVDATKAKES